MVSNASSFSPIQFCQEESAKRHIFSLINKFYNILPTTNIYFNWGVL